MHSPLTIFANRYAVVGLLGSGDMGDVFLAEDLHHDRTLVSLKVFTPRHKKDSSSIKRFRREMEITKTINHPNILRTFDSGSEGSKLFFASDYIEGVDLELELANQQLSLLEALRISYQLIAALNQIHARGIVHRDIKPENILLSTCGQLKLSDFGIAHLNGSVLTGKLDVLGTMHYVAPELFQSVEAKPSADIYGLGAVLYQMLSGALPFNSENPYQMIVEKSKGLPKRPSSVLSNKNAIRDEPQHVKDAVDEVCLRMLHPSPEKRTYNANEAKRSLKKLCSLMMLDFEQLNRGYIPSTQGKKQLRNPKAGRLLTEALPHN